jgi:hydroxymethylpyrimidine pyrophosphatase-like HAD family hydrolase
MPHAIAYLDDDQTALAAIRAARVLYTDLDGTLVARGGCVLADAEGRPSVNVATAIVAANEAGVEVVPVSGRGRLQLVELTRLLGWDSFIAEAGAVIVRGTHGDSETVYNIGGWSQDALEPGRTPYEIIDEAGAVEVLMQAFPGRIEHHAPWHDNREITHVLRGCVDADEAQSLLDGIEPPIDFVDNGLIRRRGSLTCEGDAHAYHLVPRGVTKSGAIETDLEARGMSATQAVAIGDSVTDLDMASAVGTLVLVDNALDSPGVVKALETGGYHNVVRTRGRRGDGWAELIEAWLAR